MFEIILIVGFGLCFASLFYFFFFFRRRDGPVPIKKERVPKEELERLHNQMIVRVSSGELASPQNSSILLKRGERLVLDIPGVQLCEERTVKVGGSYQGFSVRIMKGVSYRFGNFSSGSQQEVVPVDRGYFTLTNKRFVFAGARRSVECPLSKIISLDVMSDGIVVSRKGKTKTEYYVGTDAATVWATLEDDQGEEMKDKVIEWKLTGGELRRLIQHLLQEDGETVSPDLPGGN
jgi:hypothetical protein